MDNIHICQLQARGKMLLFCSLFLLFSTGLMAQTKITKEYHVPVYSTISDTLTGLTSSVNVVDRGGLDVEYSSVINGTSYIQINTTDEAFVKVVLSAWSGSTQTTYEYNIYTVTSNLEAQNDFVILDKSSSTLLIDPLANDPFDHASTKLRAINSVKYGTAVIQNGKILYTKGGQTETDIIHYTISDDTGNSDDALVYLLQENFFHSGNKVHNYMLTNVSSKYLILPHSNFNLITPVQNGTLVKIHSLVYEFVPNPGFIGEVNLVYRDITQSKIQFNLSVVSTDSDDGLVKNDVFYTPRNTSISFDVFANDLSTSGTIVSYSSQLTYTGNGVFQYSSPPNFTGTKSFYYDVAIGGVIERGFIYLNIGNIAPQSNIAYTFDVKAGSELLITYDVPISGYSFELLKSPSYGYVYTYSEGESVNTNCGEIQSKAVIQYKPINGYTGYDEFSVEYCTETYECKVYKVRVNVVSPQNSDCAYGPDAVWPGDADNDGRVSIKDLLSLARYSGKIGPSRTAQNSLWDGRYSADWDLLQTSGENLKYADSNGDGIINAQDASAILLNYNKVHSFVPEQVLNIKDLVFYIVPNTTQVDSGDVLTLDFFLGSEDDPVRDIYGVAFELAISSGFVDSSSVSVVYEKDSWFSYGSTTMDLTHQPTSGKIHTAVSRTNSAISGAGKFGSVSFIVEDEAEGFAEFGAEYIMQHIFVKDLVIKDGQGNSFTTDVEPVSIKLNLKPTGEVIEPIAVSVFPNPTSDFFSITSEHGMIQTVQLFDISGKMVKQFKGQSTSTLEVPVYDLTEGLYLVQIQADGGTFTKKVSVTK